MKYIQLICGPAGSGKTTYVTSLSHLVLQGSARRTIYCANLDPGCDSYTYDAAFDVRELIGVEDVMEEMEMGPNGATIYCHEYLLENIGEGKSRERADALQNSHDAARPRPPP